jgi:cation:H+ antiporter
MVMVYVLFVVGIYLLIKSADWIVDGGASLARRFGVSSLIIGLTVVAFGTSLPELVVNLFAAFEGASEVSFGNIIGSNIANILFVLGITVMIGKVHVRNETVWKQIPFALLAAFVLFALTSKLFFGEGTFLNRSDGLILLGIFALFLYYVFHAAKRDEKRIGMPEDSDESGFTIIWKLLLGVVGIYFGGKWVVEGAVFVAGVLGMSEFLISATVVAIGTSLPELVVCIVAVKKKKTSLAVGNIVGSNIFNILWVFGFVPLIAPVMIPQFIIFDIGVMFMSTLLLFIFMFVGKKGWLSKTEGIVFLLFYFSYLGHIIFRG